MNNKLLRVCREESRDLEVLLQSRADCRLDKHRSVEAEGREAEYMYRMPDSQVSLN
jgi:hypothetical protein